MKNKSEIMWAEVPDNSHASQMYNPRNKMKMRKIKKCNLTMSLCALLVIVLGVLNQPVFSFAQLILCLLIFLIGIANIGNIAKWGKV